VIEKRDTQRDTTTIGKPNNKLLTEKNIVLHIVPLFLPWLLNGEVQKRGISTTITSGRASQ